MWGIQFGSIVLSFATGSLSGSYMGVTLGMDHRKSECVVDHLPACTPPQSFRPEAVCCLPLNSWRLLDPWRHREFASKPSRH